MRMRESAGFDRCITAIFPCFDSALSCTKGLVEQVKFMPLSKSTYRTNHVSERSLYTAKKIIMTEWNEIEITLMGKLANILEIEKTNILKAERKCKKSTYLQSQNELIEEEIFKLENDIRQQKRALDLLDASIAPCASILCQATVHMGIHGFSFEEFRNDNILKLKFVHAVYGIQTSVIFNVNSHPGIVVEIDCDASNTYNCPIFEFHQAYLDMLVCGKIPIQFDSAELQESLLTIGQFLGRLDQSAMELEKRKASDIDLSDEETKEKIKKFVLGQASFPPF
jgi:predicted transposase YbfD/YdcC